MDLSENTVRDGVYSLATDRRARVPLAVVGVLLLLTSVTIVATMETREEPTPDVETGIVINQTESAVQTALRDGAQRAAEVAAEQPLTNASDNEWGRVLHQTDGRTTLHPTESNGTLRRDTFTRYLSALVYLEVQSNLAQVGLEDGDVETAVTVPNVEDPASFEQALDNISLREPEPGLLEVTVENVTITATRDGEVVEDRTQTMTVSIATPVVQLHDRVASYQSALDAGVTERGFSQRFNARIYAIGWARGYAQNYRLPIVEVMANRHIEPSVNSALYRTQQDIFGAADPNLQNAVRLGWLCMAMKDGAGMFDQYMDEQGLSYRNVTFHGDRVAFDHADGNTTSLDVPTEVDSVDDLCSHAEWLFGDQVTGEHPEPPDVTDLLGDAPGMNANDSLRVGEKADVPLARMTDAGHQNSFERAIQRIFTVEGTVQTTGRPDIPDDPVYSGECTNESLGPWRTVSQEQLQVVPAGRERLDPTETGTHYYEFQFKLRAQFEGQKPCRDEGPVTDRSGWQLSNTLTAVVSESEAAPNARIDGINGGTGVETKYRRGGPPTPDFRNYHGVQQTVTAQLLDEPDASTGSFSDWVESQDLDLLEDDVTTKLTTTETVEIDHHEFLETEFAGELAENISEMQSTVAEITHTFNRTEYIQSGRDSPFAELMAEVNETIRTEYLQRERPYESVGEQAIYEARYDYWQTLSRELALLRGAHARGVDSLADKLRDANATIEDALTFLQQGVSGTEPEPVALNSPPVTDNITYEVSGSPTYLVDGRLTKAEVPAIDGQTNFSALAMKNRESFDLPYDEVIDEVVTWVLNTATSFVPGIDWGSPDPTVSLRMAGDVLMAGELATETDDVDRRLSDEGYDSAALQQDLSTLDGNVEDAVEQFEREMAVRTVTELYTDKQRVIRCLEYSVVDELCEPLLEAADTAVVERLETAMDRAEAATADALAAYEDGAVDSTALKAVQIGNGNASALIRSNVTAALTDSRFYDSGFEQNYTESQWGTVVDSAARPAFEQAAAMRVEIGDGPEDAERIDNALQAALGNVSRDLVAERLEAAGEEIRDDIEGAIEDNLQEWAGKWSGSKKRPARIPAGLPLLPIPGYWYATTNAWNINAGGEYARFEVTANMGTPETATATTYVRENGTVEYEIAGEHRRLGAVEPIQFRGRSVLVVVTPPGVGVGDRTDVNPECSPNFPIVGAAEGREPDCTGELFGIEWTEETRSGG